jgi:hypothetical protein
MLLDPASPVSPPSMPEMQLHMSLGEADSGAQLFGIGMQV